MVWAVVSKCRVVGLLLLVRNSDAGLMTANIVVMPLIVPNIGVDNVLMLGTSKLRMRRKLCR